MKIIELNELQFKNYSNIHSKKNYKQSVEYSLLKCDTDGYDKIYLGLMDDDRNIIAATLLLEKKLNNKYSYGYCPNGYLIDFFNLNLLNIFTNELKKYLKKKNFIYVHLNPKIDYQIFSNKFILLENNSKVINDLKKLGYQFINNTSKYELILNSNDINKTYNNFKRTLRRDIKKSLEQGITVHKCNDQELDKCFEYINDNNYSRNLYNYFQTNHNKVEIYYTKINPEIYINNYRYLLKIENEKNNMFNKKLQNRNIKKTNKLINDKMISDKLLVKYSNEIKNATDIYTKYPNGSIVSVCAVMVSDNEVIFLSEGHNKDFSNIKTIPILKWEIIKKYLNLGYNKFRIKKIDSLDNSKYILSQGFNANIIESNNEFDLVINEMLYKINTSLNSIVKKK